MEKTINLQKLINYKDFQKGFERLKKKRKVKHPFNAGVFLRFIKKEDKEKNALSKFIDDINNDGLDKMYKNLLKYKFSPYMAISVSKGNGKYRPLLVPRPKDRLIFDSIYPLCKKELSPDLLNRSLLGLGLEKNQSIQGLLKKIYKEYILKDYIHVLTLDFSSFFSKIDRDILFKKLTKSINNNNLLEVLKLSINNDIECAQKVEEKTGVKLENIGIPQGLSYSPLLACFYATEIDDEHIKDENIVGFRYIDDILILAKKREDLCKIYKNIFNATKSLKIKIHELPTKGKTEIINLEEESVIFLGAKFTNKKATIPQSSFDKFLEICKNQIFNDRILKKESSDNIKKIYFRYVHGWLNFYKDIFNNDKLIVEKINNLLKEEHFNKRRVRIEFFKKNSWIILNINKAPYK